MTVKEGWLRKNHKGGSWSSANARRWFVSQGFHVFYYEDNTKTSIRGHFDLRNVVHIRTSTDTSAPEAVDIHVAEGATNKITKRLIVSFVMDVSTKSVWLRLWCSAIEPAYVDATLKGLIDTPLHSQYNVEYAQQVLHELRT